MYHNFNVELATEYSIEEAIFIEHFAFWIQKNKANNKNFYDGRYWTYNSHAAFAEMFPYMSAKKIRTTIDKLKSNGIIKTGNYNKSTYDRTLWYAFDDKGLSICQKVGFHLSKTANGNSQKGEPIPDTLTDTLPDSKPDTDKTALPFADFQPTDKKDKGKTEKAPRKEPFVIPGSPALVSEIEKYIVYRKEIKAPMTDYAVKLLVNQLNKLAKTDSEKIQILQQSITNGWKGVFALRGNNRVQSIHAIPDRYATFEEIFAEEIAEAANG